MKKIFPSLCLIILFSVIFCGCKKESVSNLQLYTPYADVLNPPDSFVYYIPLSAYATLQGKVQFKEDAVWRITKTAGFGTNTWLGRLDTSAIFGIVLDDTVALQGNKQYLLTASNATPPDGVKIYFMFTNIHKDYQTFSPKY